MADFSRPRNYGAVLISLVLIFGVFVFTYAFINYGYVVGLAVTAVPLVVIVLILGIREPVWHFLLLIVVNYILPIYMRRYPEAPIGLANDVLMALNVFAILLTGTYKHIQWKRILNGFMLTMVIWTCYCILELANPRMVSFSAGLSSTRTYFVYPLVIGFIVSLSFEKFKHLFWFFNVLGALTIASAIKAMVQKYIGFTPIEEEWVYGPGRVTHVLWSGIRYFSIFTDAGSFGSAMGIALVIFSITSLYVKNNGLRVYYWIVSLFALYGMLISGTRSSLIIPIVAYVAFAFLTKNVKVSVITAIGATAILLFLTTSNMGNGNSVIRRARSVFNTKDPSFQARQSNQRLIRAYMANKPFGVGMGHGGGKAKAYAPDAYLSQIPTDSWFVMMWTETGIIGLILRLLLYLYVIGYGAWIVLFKLKDKRVRGITAAITVALLGTFVNLYANEILQFPNITVFYALHAIIFLAPYFDEELTKEASDAEAAAKSLKQLEATVEEVEQE